ncbi:hypothetical protein JAAARDRAFT_51806 [Jaapia argillacea MUCL 33604]|uniref:Protein kinase domain-containing protein n=1 Tax=Jaapia argillacea MUCL 33604 TaxID=933084 RepID=A0A067P3D7_9AGAM|nr:hypothetical protein JAAARDRAFT_51806 [Jaapia argillacea MUCL 33604]
MNKVAKDACREIFIWSRLTHDNVLPLLGFSFDFSSATSLISPWMSNGSANDFLRQKPRFPSVKLLPGIADGLRHLHLSGIVHGDLRGDNILVSADLTPYLIDFGLSRELMRTLSCNPSKIGGSARWMAREYLGELNSPTEAGDVWAFGMTILELATRKPPFHQFTNEPSVILQVNSGTLPVPPGQEEVCVGWDDKLWELCTDCWALNPASRPPMQSVVERVNRFRNVEYSEPTETSPQMVDGAHIKRSFTWPVPAFCMELEDLSSKVRPTENVYFAGGGFSTLWRGSWVDPAHGPPHKLAIKAFLYSHIPQFRLTLERRLRREATLWRQLDHPNVLRFLGVCYNNIPPVLDFPALLSPLCENGNIVDYLRTHLEVKPLPLIIQVTDGLQYLHEKSVIHGDLKGSNVLIKDNGDACISDFGCSNLVGDRPQHSSTTVISVRWTAPEMLLEIPDDLEEDVDSLRATPTKASDVWSFAMTVLEVFKGSVPWFELRNDASIIMRLLAGKTPSRHLYPTISDPIWDLLSPCWKRDPRMRPHIQDIAQRLKIINTAMDTRPDLTPPQSGTYESRTMRRPPTPTYPDETPPQNGFSESRTMRHPPTTAYPDETPPQSRSYDSPNRPYEYLDMRYPPTTTSRYYPDRPYAQRRPLPPVPMTTLPGSPSITPVVHPMSPSPYALHPDRPPLDSEMGPGI